MNCCLVIDISKVNLKIFGVSFKEEKIFIQEIHKCCKIIKKNRKNISCLNIEKIIGEINETLINVNDIGYKVDSISVNSSMNTFVLLDSKNNLVQDIFIDDDLSLDYFNKAVNELGASYIYRKTGISLDYKNLFYRLIMYKDLYKDDILRVNKILSLSDYINYRLTGKITNEKIQLSLSQIFNFKYQNIDKDILDYLDLGTDLEFNLVNYGESIGQCKMNGVEVIAPYGNSLLSSFFTTDLTNKNSIFIVNSYEGIIGCTEDFTKLYFEGNRLNFNHQLLDDNKLVKVFKYIPCYKTIDDFLKNVENRYIVESVWNIENGDKSIDYIIDFDSEVFRNSIDLINVVKYYFEIRLNNLPDAISTFIKVVYDSFAVYYKKCIKDLEKVTGGIFENICMVGDYNVDESYSQFLADITLKDIEIGPKNSGIIGNAMNQFLSLGKIKNISDIYSILKNSIAYKKIKYSGKKIHYRDLKNIG